MGGLGLTPIPRSSRALRTCAPMETFFCATEWLKARLSALTARSISSLRTRHPCRSYTRLMDKYGNVITRNVFTKQAKYTIMDVVPILPGRAVKEGDSWPSEMQLIVDGLMSINLSGTSMLDSFEWQNGASRVRKDHIAEWTCGSSISVANGKIREDMGAGAKAQVVTYFAYKSGKMLLRQLPLTSLRQSDTGISELGLRRHCSTGGRAEP